MDRLKCSPVPLVIYHLQRALLALLPNPPSRFIIDFLANKCSAVVTNIKGPARDLTLEGRRVRSIMFWVPQRARIGIGISILSFSGKVQVGVIADEALVPDPAALVQAFEEEFETLEVLAALEPGPASAPEAGLRAPEPGHPAAARRKAKPKAAPHPGRPAASGRMSVQEIRPTLIADDPAGLHAGHGCGPVEKSPCWSERSATCRSSGDRPAPPDIRLVRACLPWMNGRPGRIEEDDGGLTGLQVPWPPLARPFSSATKRA